jgi:hypothetical protein
MKDDEMANSDLITGRKNQQHAIERKSEKP